MKDKTEKDLEEDLKSFKFIQRLRKKSFKFRYREMEYAYRKIEKETEEINEKEMNELINRSYNN